MMSSSQASGSPTYNNGNGSNNGSPPPVTNGNVTGDQGSVHMPMSQNAAGGPSKVVHIRNIPNEANDSDIINLGLPFGKIANILLLKGKNQAFIEFADVSSAQCMVSYWQVNSLHTQPTVRGRHVFCQFSNHQQLKPHQNPNQGGGGGGHHAEHDGMTPPNGTTNVSCSDLTFSSSIN